MARKNSELNKVNCCKPRLPKNPSPKGFKTISSVSPSPMKGDAGRISPANSLSTDKSQSPRTSPGLTAGYYAGCKFTEPPSPSSLPKPPQHWMMQSSRVVIRTFAPETFDCSFPHLDIAQQLKVLLKVQA